MTRSNYCMVLHSHGHPVYCCLASFHPTSCFGVQEIDILQSTVHQECAERTVILEQLNSLRRDASLPPLPMTEVTALAKRYLQRQESSMPKAVATTTTPQAASLLRPPSGSLGRAGSFSSSDVGVTLPPVPRSRGSVSAEGDDESDGASDHREAAGAWAAAKSQAAHSSRGKGRGGRGR